jgi:hypothetical protein
MFTRVLWLITTVLLNVSVIGLWIDGLIHSEILQDAHTFWIILTYMNVPLMIFNLFALYHVVYLWDEQDWIPATITNVFLVCSILLWTYAFVGVL